MSDLWRHQEEGIDATVSAFADGHRCVVLTSPTGMGKSRIVCEIIKHYVGRGWYAVVYSNRRLLIEQLAGVLEAAGIECGVRAAGHEDNRDLPVQISSVPTEAKRTIKREQWAIHGANRKCIAVIDECHANNGPTAQELIRRHVEDGHCVLGVSATPLDLGGTYSHLVTAGRVSDGRACGALVRCLHYGPDEPDLADVKADAGEDISEAQARKAFGDGRNGGDDRIKALFGRVLPWFSKLNPEAKPAILFASGVPESLWFAHEFTKAGLPAAHIDGTDCWFGGRLIKTSQTLREDILAASASGSVKVLCNRFVLREGIDAPWLAHGVFATTFGSLQSYLQAGGRLPRAHPSTPTVTLQDHGGNWHRHGSLNVDRTWALGLTNAQAAGLREDGLRARKQKEPYRCPKCGLILGTRVCLECGYEREGKATRPVVQTDGTLKELTGDIYVPRRVAKFSGAVRKWITMYYRSRNSDRTFRQAEGLFSVENYGQWPDRGWPLMPLNELDFFLKVKDVPPEALRQPEGSQA